MKNEQRQQILSRLNGRSRVAAFEAAKTVWEYSDPRLERPLIQTLKHGRRPFNRAAAAFAMQMVTSPRTIKALEKVVRNRSESTPSGVKRPRRSPIAIAKDRTKCCS